MFTFSKTSEKNRTALYVATIPVKDIEKRYDETLKELAAKAKVEGFRPGSAPLELAKKNIGQEKVYDHLIQHLLPDVYKELVQKENVKPVSQPRVELKKAKEKEDWEIEFAIPLEPTVKLPDYKKAAQKVKGELKKDDIWVPGASDPKKPDEDNMKKRENMLNMILEDIIENTSIDMSEIILEQEINSRLSKLVDDVRKIGLTIDAYLTSKNLTQDQLKEQLKKDVLNTYKLEYALNEIGDKENITIDNKEVEALFSNIKDDKERETAEKNSYVYASMLRKQKIIDFLAGL